MFKLLKSFYKEDVEELKNQLREEIRQEIHESLKEVKRGHCVFDSMFMNLKNNGSDKTFTADETEARIQYNEEKRLQERRKARCDYYNKENRNILNLNNNVDYLVELVHNKVAEIIKEGNFEEYRENDHGYDLFLKEDIKEHFESLDTLRDVLKINCENNDMSNYIITKRDFITKFFEGSRFSDLINDLKVFYADPDEFNQGLNYYNVYDSQEVFYEHLDETINCSYYGWEDSDSHSGLTDDKVMRALAILYFLVNYTKRSFEKYNCVILISGNHSFDICTDEEIL
jgi:hypothetical protein